jgi:adenylate cyclase
VLIAASRQLGFVNLLSENDKDDMVQHRSPLLASYHDQLVMSLPLAAIWTLAGEHPMTVKDDVLSFGDTKVPVNDKVQFYLWWYQSEDDMPVFPTYTAAQVFMDKVAMGQGGDAKASQSPRLPAGTFKDKIVIVGSTATGLLDIKATPLEKAVPGVFVQATALQNLLSGDFVTRWPARATGVVVFLFCTIIGAVSRASRRVIPAVIFVIVSGICVVWVAYSALAVHRLFVDMVPVLVGGFGTFTICATVNVLAEKRHSSAVRGIFEHYLDGSVVKELIANPESLRLGGETRHCTVLFADVAGFTSMSEMMTPEQVVTVMNMYLNAMTEIIVSESGFVDKYVGDEIVAVFGAPNRLDDHAARACSAALRMSQCCDEMQQQFKEAGCASRLFARMGIGTGDMVVGNMGSEKRMNYTVMGDVVNLGARVMSVNKMYGTTIMMTQGTFDAVEGQVSCREVDAVRVVGKKDPVVLYELRDGSADSDEAYSEGLSLYRKGQWDKSLEAFRGAADAGDPAAAEFVSRCESHVEAPPADWDGVHDMLMK